MTQGRAVTRSPGGDGIEVSPARATAVADGPDQGDARRRSRVFVLALRPCEGGRVGIVAEPVAAGELVVFDPRAIGAGRRSCRRACRSAASRSLGVAAHDDESPVRSGNRHLMLEPAVDRPGDVRPGCARDGLGDPEQGGVDRRDRSRRIGHEHRAETLGNVPSGCSSRSEWFHETVQRFECAGHGSEDRQDSDRCRPGPPNHLEQCGDGNRSCTHRTGERSKELHQATANTQPRRCSALPSHDHTLRAPRRTPVRPSTFYGR